MQSDQDEESRDTIHPVSIARCVGLVSRSYAYDVSEYRSRVGHSRTGDVADKHLHSHAGGIKSLLNVVVFVIVLVWLLQGFGLIGNISGVHFPALK